MDINSLLSPQDSPARETPPPHPSIASPAIQSPSKRAIRQMPSRTPSGLSQQITSSPQPQPQPQPHPQPQPQQQHLGYHPTPPPNNPSFTNGHRPIHSATSTPPIPIHSPRDAGMNSPHPPHRQTSTPGMDALADLATIQHHQQAVRQSSVAQRPPFSLQNIPRTISGGSVRSDVSMAEASPKPRIFASKALEQEHVDYLVQLDKTLSENPLDYYSHVSFVTVLHQGFEYHMSSVDPGNPRSYELLAILRDAYQTMAKRYPLGEVLWQYRLNDEKILASNMEDRMTVLELYKHATMDEPYSTNIWLSYGEYVTHLMACSWEQNPPEQWSGEDRGFGRELFTPQLLLDIWQQGADKVKYSIQDSSMVWDRYLQFLRDDLQRSAPNTEKTKQVLAIYRERLGQPHATWGNTLSNYASFVSAMNLDVEDAMEQAVQQNTHIKQQYANREDFEFKLLQAVQQGDRDAEYYAMTRYLKWEKKTVGVYSTHLVNALYERATLRFPVDSTLWEDHVEFLIWQNDRSNVLLDVVERATQHCPWSGSLWSHRILTLEAEQRRFEEIEGVKHTATNTGLLEHNDIEELIKVQLAWCGYLRRKAFDQEQATEDDADIAEVGIRSALEHVSEVGMKKYGRNWPGDPKYRLERIHIKFWLQRGNVTEARNIWNSLVAAQKDSYDFWYRYYIWEMVVWANHAVRDSSNAGRPLPTPSGATAVLEKGMERLTTVDQPEPLIEMYVNHCEQHESVLKVRNAQIERRRSERIVSIRRQKEAEAAAATQQDQSATVFPDVSSKRKREDINDDTPPVKKTRQDAAEETPPDSATRAVSEAPSNAASTTQKRDREHAAIIVQRLPVSVTQIQLRQFFTDVGNVRNVTLKPEATSTTAFVEFETPEEADYAQTKAVKGFLGHEITIVRSESTTLYVANYPPEADESYIRKLFSPFGEIINIRFPSLKFNTHRRFCYVQYADSGDAMAATKLDNTDVEGFKLIAKISNPNAKKKRDGATAEGREVYVWHLNFKIKKHEIQEAFAPYGKIDRVNIPTLPNGNNKGFGYIVYASKESADAAVADLHEKERWGLQLKVQVASDKNDTAPKFKSTIENAASAGGERDATPAADAPITNPVPLTERSIGLMNLPDTVNDARVKALVEPYGYKKITLMPIHGGAIVEFSSVDAAGKAEIALQGKDFEGRKLRVGTVAELKKQKGEFKPSSNFVKPAQVKRPTAAAGRGGVKGRGRPGLGQRPALPRVAAAASEGEAKSNQDFRAMLLGKKDEQGKSVEDNMKE